MLFPSPKPDYEKLYGQAALDLARAALHIKTLEGFLNELIAKPFRVEEVARRYGEYARNRNPR